MKRWLVAIVVILITVQSLAQDKDKDKAKDQGGRFVYADFEQLKEGRPVSTRGGMVLMSGFEAVQSVSYTNSDKPWPRMPMVVPAAQNHSQLVAFNFSIPAGNAYAGVSLEIHGMPEKDGKQVGEDLSAYNYLVVQVIAQGTETLRAELVTKDNGVSVKDGESYGANFPLKPGFNVYRLPIKQFTQPKWDTVIRVDLKDVLKHLTSVNFIVQKIPSVGQVVLDNVAFEK
jgi:hypothetical protein